MYSLEQRNASDMYIPLPLARPDHGIYLHLHTYVCPDSLLSLVYFYQELIINNVLHLSSLAMPNDQGIARISCSRLYCNG